jgi:hypothetical protein
MTEQDKDDRHDEKDGRDHEHKHPEPEPPGRIIHPRPSHGDTWAR